MKLIVGLGNPGDTYIDSRHNVGFSLADLLAEDHKAVWKRDRGTFSLSVKIKIEDQPVVLAKPLTFMNLSGNAVRDLLKKHKVPPEDLLVVCDDLDLELGRIRIRPEGSSGGHKGLKSVIDSLGSENFARLRIGIGRPSQGKDASDYVLERFRKVQLADLQGALDDARSCCEVWATKGITEAMNIFNKRR